MGREKKKRGMGLLATLNVGKTGFFDKAFKTLQEAVNNAIDGDIIQINMKSIALDRPIQNIQSGVRIQGNPNLGQVTIYPPKRNIGFYLGSGQKNMEFANLKFIVPEQTNAISVVQGGTLVLDNVTMLHEGGLSERVIRPSLAFTTGNSMWGGALILRNSVVDVLSCISTQFQMSNSNVGNILATPRFSSSSISVITAPSLLIEGSGIQHIGFMGQAKNGDDTFQQAMIIRNSFVGANTIFQRKAEINNSVITPIVSINQDVKHLYYPSERGYMPGVIVTSPNATVTVNKCSIFDHFSEQDAARNSFAQNYMLVSKKLDGLVPFSPFSLFNKGTLIIKQMRIPLSGGTNIADNGQLTLDNVQDQSMWQMDNPNSVKLTNRQSSSQLFQQNQQNALGVGTNDGENQQSAWAELRQMIGQANVKKQYQAFMAKQLVQQRKKQLGIDKKNKDTVSSSNMVFLGPPGVGKSTVARIFAKGLYEIGVVPTPNLVEVTASKLVSDHVGGTAKQTDRVIRSAYGGVLFIDEAYILAPDENGGNTFKDEAVTEIVEAAEKDRDKLVIIMAGYTNEMNDFFNRGNPGLKRRFPNIIKFEGYSQREIKQIMYLMLKTDGVIIADTRTRQMLEHGVDLLFGSQDGDSGQAGFARNFCDKVKDERDLRLMRSGNINQMSSRDLNLITVEDVQLAIQNMSNQLGAMN